MRSSSIKSFAATLTLAAVVSTAAAVNLQARPATRNANETVVSVRDTATSYDRASAAVRRFVRRFFGPVTNVLPTIPIPGEPPAQATTTSN
jgi:hypothetical protein